MLADRELFNSVETGLRERGILADFEKMHGRIRGRMMITETEIPEEFGVELPEDAWAFAFQATFDFYDCAVGIAMNLDTMTPLCGLWLTPQIEDAEPPSDEWIQFFIKTLFSNIGEDGNFGLPMYTFATDTGDFTAVPIPEPEQE